MPPMMGLSVNWPSPLLSTFVNALKGPPVLHSPMVPIWKPEGQIVHSAEHPTMPDIVSAPAILVSEVEGILVGDSSEVPLVGIVVAVIAESVVGVKLQLAGITALERKRERIVVRSSRALLRAHDGEVRVGPIGCVKTRPDHWRS